MSRHVVHVTPRYPPRTGGVETHVAAVAEGLAHRGDTVTVVSADRERGEDRRERRNEVRVRRVRSLAPGGVGHLAPGVLRALWRIDPDVVHAHNYHSLPVATAALALSLRQTEVPFVVTPHYHGGSVAGIRDRLLSAYEPVGRRALRRADAVVAVSEWERRQLRDHFGVEARVIPNGLDVDRFRAAEPASRERPYLLTVGRLVEYKGVEHAIRALANPGLCEFDLIVAGAGPDRSRLARIARESGVDDRVTFAGYVDDERLAGLYAGATAHLSFSTFESYGMTVAEALAAGTPSVVREAGALVDWAARADCVGVVDPTPGAVASAVDDVRRVEPTAEGLLSWDDVVDDLSNLYDAVC